MHSIPPPLCPFCDHGPGKPTSVKHENWVKTIHYSCEGCGQTWSVSFPDHEQRIQGVIPEKPA